MSRTIIISNVLLCIAALLMICCAKERSVVNDGYGDYLPVPAGEFRMGDNFDEGNSDEIPVHTVFLDDYYIGKHKITNGEYGKFIEDGGYVNSEYWNAGGFGEYGDNPEYWNSSGDFGGGIAGNEEYPVVGVSWFEAAAYCVWVSEKTGKAYRLPTEAEWEKAARGTGQRRYAWGNEIDEHYANYDNGGDRSTMKLKPVGFYDGSTHDGFTTRNNASPYGAYDMTGNISEWCSDWYDMKYYRNSPGKNPTGPPSGVSRVLRAGGYVDSAYYQRAAGRHKMDAHYKSYKT
ncbi:formylglycine-generating enzyme family protein, partial [candidate division KSB1 bacterium]